MIDQAEFYIYEGEEDFVAQVCGPRAEAWAEAMRYASQCDEPNIQEITRAECELGPVPPLKSWGSLSDFIRNATEEEKRAVYDIVMERANARQLATLETPHKPLHSACPHADSHDAQPCVECGASLPTCTEREKP